VEVGVVAEAPAVEEAGSQDQVPLQVQDPLQAPAQAGLEQEARQTTPSSNGLAEEQSQRLPSAAEGSSIQRQPATVVALEGPRPTATSHLGMELTSAPASREETVDMEAKDSLRKPWDWVWVLAS